MYVLVITSVFRLPSLTDVREETNTFPINFEVVAVTIFHGCQSRKFTIVTVAV